MVSEQFISHKHKQVVDIPVGYKMTASSSEWNSDSRFEGWLLIWVGYFHFETDFCRIKYIVWRSDSLAGWPHLC